MKFNFLLLTAFAFLLLNSSQLKAQALNTGDSLALVDLYNSTNGPGWINHTNWLTSAPASTWYGVTVDNGRLTQLFLTNNKLAGTIPNTIFNFSEATSIVLNKNQLSGNIPPSIGSLRNVIGIDFSDNQLSGNLSFSQQPLSPYFFIKIYNNRFNFSGLEDATRLINTNINLSLSYEPQGDIPITKTGNTYSVSAGGTVAFNTYKWYRNNILVATKTGDSTYTSDEVGDYNVEIQNKVVNQNNMVLYGFGKADIKDSLTLVNLYNRTNGTGWSNNSNWLTSAPLNTWYGATIRFGKVKWLNLSLNNLAGPIPDSLFNLSNLESLDLSNNKLSGSLPSTDGLLSISTLYLNYNQLTGNLPANLGNTSQITFLGLSYNNFSGNIPASIANIDYTRQLDINNNNLDGNIPAALGNISHLQQLSLGNNHLTGTIPEELGNTELNTLALQNNNLTGNIPVSLGQLSQLSGIFLNDNLLTGHIPSSFSNLKNITALELQNNQLDGAIPLMSRSSANMHHIYLENNKFNFDGMETLPAAAHYAYAPQAKISLNRKDTLFSVTAGGTLANDTFRLYKDGVLNATNVGDSVFATNTSGRYNITVNNTIASQLTLLSDTTGVNGISLANAGVTVTQNISGTNFVNIEDNSAFPNVLLATVIPTAGANALSGDISCKMVIDPTVSTYNGQPYVQRHYDITPASNASTAASTVVLYFTQQDFNSFNSAPSHGPDLPGNPTDSAGIANLRVYQYHGFSATSLPRTYSGPAVEINPDDKRIFWNPLGNYWEVSFEVTGFSGFFVSSQSSALLPVKLLSFTGKLQDKTAVLQWSTSSEINTSVFELQRGTDGNSFTSVASIFASGNSNSVLAYQYADIVGNEPVYFYRLKIVDKDGKFGYSAVIKINNTVSSNAFTVYPNPAKEFVNVQVPVSLKTTDIKLMDVSGKTLQSKTVAAGVNKTSMNVRNLSAGIYKIVISNGGKIQTTSLVIE